MKKDTEFNERFLQFQKAISPTQVDFAEKLEVTPQTLQKYIKGSMYPGAELLKRMNKLGCDINWLLNGVGEMIHEVKTFKPRTKPVPIIAEVECGIPIQSQMMHEDIKHLDMFDVSGLNSPFLVVARGDSMVPYINPGDLLLCSDDPEKIKDGKAVIVNYKSTPESYMSNAKLITFDEDEVLLYSVNSKYKPKTYKKSEIFKIYKVVRVIRDVK